MCKCAEGGWGDCDPSETDRLFLAYKRDWATGAVASSLWGK